MQSELPNNNIYKKKLYFFRLNNSDPDTLHFAGSGSTSGNVELDPGCKKNRDKLT